MIRAAAPYTGRLCLLLALLLVPSPTLAAQPAEPPPADPARPVPRLAPAPPGAMKRLPYDPDPPAAVAPPRPAWQRRDRVAYAFDKPSLQIITPAPDLSKLCRQGRFNQRIDMAYRAFGPGERPLGVAYGFMAVNLIDPLNRRQTDTVYFFRDHDGGRCQVFTARLDDLKPWFVGP